MKNLLLHLKVGQNLYPQTSHIPSITLSGYYHDVIKQQVNNSDEFTKVTIQ